MFVRRTRAGVHCLSSVLDNCVVLRLFRLEADGGGQEFTVFLDFPCKRFQAHVANDKVGCVFMGQRVASANNAGNLVVACGGGRNGILAVSAQSASCHNSSHCVLYFQLSHIALVVLSHHGLSIEP